MGIQQSLLNKIRFKMRGVVLPLPYLRQRVLTYLHDYLQGNLKDKRLLDFGAGTFFWSVWFKDLGLEVFAVDPLYEKQSFNATGIHTFASIADCFNRIDQLDIAWCCDVFHHLKKVEADENLARIAEKANMILIKDIDSQSSWGTFQNKVHDFVFNRQWVRSVSSIQLCHTLEKLGFTCEVVPMPHKGFSHFLLVATKIKRSL